MKTFQQIRTKAPRAKDTKLARPNLIHTNDLTMQMWLDLMYDGVKKRTSQYNADKWKGYAKQVKGKTDSQILKIAQKEISSSDKVMKTTQDDLKKQDAWGTKLDWQQIIKKVKGEFSS